ncbi:IEC3 subunit of the Ino80 complex, chromatin re-modelling-domain-containing protein [Aspergillus avenaceus]|uniref:IEC3 subunit of the Ino80 complex, chromatin re-modelling-domain-containing protein n=1 Tax=Aspergillus avenaceus TaxID=36643 RepID=A0A5N6TFB5_ASPAV|nr:IEC3 subunit of the Ino80 complex, chromatin re-modelling-domain-containing protein [Aspergillus avenaceus]
MSQEVDEVQSMAESLPDAPASAPTRQTYRSFKKKFAKLKVRFELGMRESESLIREELRIQDLSKRIQEQNDQLLEVLLEFNDSLHISPDVRYDLSAPGDDSFLPTPERELSPLHNDPSMVSLALRNAKSELSTGNMTLQHYHDLEVAVKRSDTFAPRMQYDTLLKIPHTPPQSEGKDQPGNHDSESKLGFFTPEHETEYYLATDAKLGDESAAVQLTRAPEKPSFTEREREAALRNSISVYNWLRRNQPHIFLQDNENASEKSTSRPSNLRASKKASNQARKDDDTHDDDSVMMDTAPGSGSSKNKRKRDEDVGYRPKGGSNSRASRKKKDDGNSSTKRSSKRTSGIGA